MGTPLQRRDWVCRSEACSPYLGQRLVIRRQVPLSARTFPYTGRTLPCPARCCSALSPNSSTPHAPHAIFGSPVRLHSRRQQQQTRGKAELGDKKQQQLSDSERGQRRVGAFSESGGREEDEKRYPVTLAADAALLAPLNESVRTGQVSAACLWKRSRSQCWDTWWKQRGAGFQ